MPLPESKPRRLPGGVKLTFLNIVLLGSVAPARGDYLLVIHGRIHVSRRCQQFIIGLVEPQHFIFVRLLAGHIDCLQFLANVH